MAGAYVELDLSGQSASTSLHQLGAALQGDGLTLLLSDIGEYLLRSTRDRAALELAPDGKRWHALEPSYERWKSKVRPGVPILKFDNHMIGDQFTHQVEGDTLLVGTNAPYGAAHQFGSTRQVEAHTRDLHFHHANGEVSPQFVNKRKANFVQSATVPAHEVTVAARPWLGLSDSDQVEIVALTQDHLRAALSGGFA